MIFTQTLSELGNPPWTPVGFYFFSVEPTDARGFGVDDATLVAEAVKQFKANKPGYVMVAAKIKIRPGSGHPSYRCRNLRITGDICVVNADPAKIPCGFKEL